jgi:hypothetical protein
MAAGFAPAIATVAAWKWKFASLHMSRSAD